jgi:hypothetical protein
VHVVGFASTSGNRRFVEREKRLRPTTWAIPTSLLFFY